MKFTELKREKNPAGCDRAYARFDGVKVRFGKWGPDTEALPETREKYNRYVAEYLTTKQAPVTKNSDVTINVLVDGYIDYVKELYKGRTWEDRKHGSEVDVALAFKQQIIPLYGTLHPDEFRAKSLLAVRQSMKDQGLYRKTINKRVNWIQKAFEWGVTQDMVDIVTYTSLTTVKPIKEGEFNTREFNVVVPVSRADVDKTLGQSHPVLHDMIKVQMFGAMRAQDVRLMRLCDIHETSNPDIWLYKPHTHKKSYKNTQADKNGKVIKKKPRTIILLPECQDILMSYVSEHQDTPDEYFFSPDKAMKMLSIQNRKKRKTKVQPSQQLRKTNAPGRRYRACYSRKGYILAVARAAKRAGVAVWRPHQLRHAGATYIAEKYGEEMARVILGHDSVETTRIYIDPHIKEKEYDNKIFEAGLHILASRASKENS